MTRRPTSSAAICTGVASPREHHVERRRQLGRIGRFASGEPFDRSEKRVRRGLPDTECFDEALGQARVRRDERDDQAEQANAIDVFFAEYTALRAIREVHDAHELVVIDERKADERPGREVLIAGAAGAISRR